MTTAQPSVNDSLAAAIRRLNARLADLSPQRAAELQGEWHKSWANLQRGRETADPAEQYALVAAWEDHWHHRLG